MIIPMLKRTRVETFVTLFLLTIPLFLSMSLSAEAGNKNTPNSASSSSSRNAGMKGDAGPASTSAKKGSPKGPLKLDGVKGESMDDQHKPGHF